MALRELGVIGSGQSLECSRDRVDAAPLEVNHSAELLTSFDFSPQEHIH